VGQTDQIILFFQNGKKLQLRKAKRYEVLVLKEARGRDPIKVQATNTTIKYDGRQKEYEKER
jgi:hypothetical protein